MPHKTLFLLLAFLVSCSVAWSLPADQDDRLEALGVYLPNFFAELQDVELQDHRAFVFGVGGLV